MSLSTRQLSPVSSRITHRTRDRREAKVSTSANAIPLPDRRKSREIFFVLGELSNTLPVALSRTDSKERRRNSPSPKPKKVSAKRSRRRTREKAKGGSDNPNLQPLGESRTTSGVQNGVLKTTNPISSRYAQFGSTSATARARDHNTAKAPTPHSFQNARASSQTTRVSGAQA